jgi:adenylate cyclase
MQPAVMAGWGAGWRPRPVPHPCPDATRIRATIEMKTGAAASVLLAAAALAFPAATAALHEGATDALMRTLAPRPAAEAPPVAMVAIGEADLATLGPWPWPRARIAALVARIAEAGAAAVALDIAFAEPSPDDPALAAALADAPAVLALLAGGAPAAPRGFGVALLGMPDLSRLTTLPGAMPVAVGGAPAALAVLPGETVRAAPLLVRLGTGEGAPLVPGLALAGLARALGVETLVLREGDPTLLQLGPYALPLPPDGMLRLHPARTRVPVLPAAAALSGGDAAAAMLRGRVVLLGATAPEAAPLRPSVLGPFTPSLALQAEAVAQLAAGWVPHRPPSGALAEAGLALLLGVAVAALVAWRPGPGLALALAIGLAWPAAAVAALRFGPILLDPVLPAGAALLAGAAEAAAGARRLARERARLVDRFAHRVPAGVVDRLLALPAEERLRPERRKVAVIITDLAGFSAMVRGGDPASVVALLNAYLAGVEAAVTAHGGTLERLIGDSVLAVFGAPLDQPDREARALAAARAIDAFAEAFRARPDAAALGWGETRIGLAAGEVLVGELGGSRLTWTVCGDAANIAARLQELAKELGLRALATGITDPSLPPPIGHFPLRGLPGDPVAVHPIAPCAEGAQRSGGSAPAPSPWGREAPRTAH